MTVFCNDKLSFVAVPNIMTTYCTLDSSVSHEKNKQRGIHTFKIPKKTFLRR